MKKKITLMSDNWELTFKEDYTEFAEDMIESDEKYNENNIEEYFANGEFEDDEINDLNGKHFLFGFIESLYQSRRCPQNLILNSGDIKYKVEDNEGEY